jgi:hypothetical protein
MPALAGDGHCGSHGTRDNPGSAGIRTLVHPVLAGRRLPNRADGRAEARLENVALEVSLRVPDDQDRIYGPKQDNRHQDNAPSQLIP